MRDRAYQMLREVGRSVGATLVAITSKHTASEHNYCDEALKRNGYSDSNRNTEGSQRAMFVGVTGTAIRCAFFPRKKTSIHFAAPCGNGNVHASARAADNHTNAPAVARCRIGVDRVRVHRAVVGRGQSV